MSWSAQHSKNGRLHTARDDLRYGRSERNANHKDVQEMERFLKDVEAFRLHVPGISIPPEAYHAGEEDLLERLRQLDASASGPSPLGRVVSWPAADGQAFYFVKSVRGPVCNLVHIPIGDAYHSETVCEGMALTRAVEKRLMEQAVLASHPQYSRWAVRGAAVLK